MAYGTVKVDNIIFTNGGIDQTVTVSGIVQSISGNITATGTIQGATIIGTSTVSGTTITGSVGNFGSGSAAAPAVSVGTTDNGIYSPGTDQVALSTSGTGRLFVDASGKIGINTSSAYSLSAPLDDLHIAGGNPALLLEETAAGTDEKYWRIRADGSILRFEGVNDTFSNATAWLNVTRSTGARTADNIAFSTGTSERLRIDSAGLVGIGTSSPSNLLHLENSSNSTSLLISPATGTHRASTVFSNTGGDLRFGLEGSSAGNLLSGSSTYSAVLAHSGSYSMHLGTANTAAITIDSSQRVGVGILTPGELLHLSGGNIKLGMSIGARQALIFSDKYQTITGEGVTNDLLYRTNSNHIWKTGTGGSSITDGSERARIDSSGRLLVGTSSAPTTGVYAQWSKLVSYGSTGGGAQPGIIALVRSAAPSSVSGQAIGAVVFAANSGEEYATITAVSDSPSGTGDYPGRLVFSVTADGSASPTEALRISNDRSITVSDGGNIVVGTTTGTKIGTATSQKIGFFDATPVVQPTTGVAEAAFVENSGGTAVNVDSTFGGYTLQQVVQALQNLGILA